MIKIAAPHVFITTDTIGGVWTYSLALARGFAADGVTVTVAVLGPQPTNSQQAELENIEGCRLLSTGLPLEWTLSHTGEICDLVQALQAFAVEASATSVHLHALTLAALPWPVHVVAVGHSCMATWWDTVHGSPRPVLFATHAELALRGLRNANLVVAPSRAFGNLLQTTYGDRNRIRVVHNGLPQITPDSAERDLFVLSAGRIWDEGKNLATLDEVARSIGVPVKVAGPAVSPSGVRAQLSSVQQLGTLKPNDLQTEMASCAMFASCSIYEPFGLTVLEAARLGTPLILSDIPTFRELWTGAALFVQPRAVSDWTKAIERLCADPSLRTELGEAAERRSRRYSQAWMVKSTLRLHNELCRDDRRAA